VQCSTDADCKDGERCNVERHACEPPPPGEGGPGGPPPPRPMDGGPPPPGMGPMP
jgi:hypothetical protein